MLAISFRPARLSVSGRNSEPNVDRGSLRNYFSMLGVTPFTGRLFQPGEGERRGVDFVAVLGFDCWQTRLGGP